MRGYFVGPRCLGLPIKTRTKVKELKLERKDSLSEEGCDEVDFKLPDVNTLDDICDAIDICEEYQIPYDGLDVIDDFVERIQLHFRKTKTLESRKTEIERAIVNAGKDDALKRQKLQSVMTELIKIVRTHKESPAARKRGSVMVGSLLRTEGTSQDLEKDCLKHADQIEHGECLILVAGETSAGKSSVLNLLFENDVLPVHTKSSTSVITIVRYASKAHAKVVYKTNEPERTFDLDDDGLKELHAFAFMENASQREGHNIQEIQVFLPSALLKSGLVFVDTPGIGENEFLESELSNFIGNNTIHGFIYIIKTDNAGGVQEDRLLNLLKIVIGKQQQGFSRAQVTRFNPKAALFVCNRFDLVDKGEQSQVRENAIKRLSECWPNFDENQIIFFSAEKAKRDFDVDPDYINNDFKMFLEGLRYLFVSIIDRRIITLYKWIENILRRTVHHLKSVVKRLDYSDMHLKEKSESTRTKLDNLQKRSDCVISTVQEELNEKAQILCKSLRAYICDDSIKTKLTTGWLIDDLPSLDRGLGNWEWVKSKIYEAFYDKMCACISEWDCDNQIIDTIETGMTEKVKIELNLLQDELYQIEGEMQGDSSSEESDVRESLRNCRISTADIDSVSPLRQSNVSASELKLPIKLAGRLLNPVNNIITNIRKKNRLDKFRKDPIQTAEDKAKALYSDLLSQTDAGGFGFKPFVDYLLERPRDYLNVLKKKIPQFIESNKMQLNMIQQSIEIERDNQNEYDCMMTEVENLRRALNEYGEGYIYVNDFMENEIQIQRINADGEIVSVGFNTIDFQGVHSKMDDFMRKRDIHGLWTITYCGTLKRSDEAIPVGIRCYLPSSEVNSTFREVAKLRCLTSRGVFIAAFLGIYHAQMTTPAFIYGGSLKPVRRFLQSFCSKRECVPTILEDTVCGLDYLHKKGLVHMELSQDTVTVDEHGAVQMTGACIPRQASLPDDPQSRETQNFVYLAPEVLRGQMYDASADIYSFGLFLIELVVAQTNGLVFTEQRLMTLCDFIGSVHPETMLKLIELLQDFSIKTRIFVQQCLAIHKEDRPSMDEVVERTFLIKTETGVLEKLPSRYARGKVMKRQSQDTKL